MVRAAVLLVLSSASIASAGIAAADPVRLEVTSDRCDLAPVRPAVVALAGGDPFDDAAGRVIRIDGTQLTDAPIARIWFDDGHGGLRGPRVVEAASCAELVDSVALVVTMALPHDPPPRQEHDPEPEDHDVAEPAPVTPRATNASVLLGAATTEARGANEQIFVGVRWRRGSTSATISVQHDATATVAVSPMAHVDISRDDVMVSPCLHAGALAACAVAGLGVLRGAGVKLAGERTVVSPIAFGGLAVTWERALTARLAVRAHLAVDALVTSTVFEVDNMPVWTSARFEGAAGFGLLVHFR